ncbi:MAG: hypothetical protein ACXACI_09190 [Candidatus Hodarchaeales archaeon]|jgi:hypothetical protein
MDRTDAGIGKRTALSLFISQTVISVVLLWAGAISIGMALPLGPVTISSTLYYPMGAAVIIPLLGCMLFLFSVGVLTDIRMSETPLLVFASPVASTTLFVLSANLLLGGLTLIETAIYMILGAMLFIASGLPILLILSIFAGNAVQDRITTGTTVAVERYFIKAKTFAFVSVIVIAITLIYQVNHLLFPSKDPGFVLGESILFLAFFFGLIKISLNEKLTISAIGTVISVIVQVMLGLPLAPMAPLLVAAPLSAYLTDALGLNISKVRPSPVATTIAILFPVFIVSYLLPYFLISNRAIFYTILALGIATILLTIRYNLQLEEGAIIGAVVTLSLMAVLLVEDLLPRYEMLINDEETNLVIGHIFLPFFVLIVGAVFLGLLFRENVLYIASDGHRLANRGERILDDWLTGHGLAHEVHQEIADMVWVSFVVEKGNQKYNLHYFSGVRQAEEIARHQKFQNELTEKNLEVDFIYGLGSLDNQLEYILRGEKNISQTPKVSQKRDEVKIKKDTPAKKDLSTFKGFWKQKDHQTAS